MKPEAILVARGKRAVMVDLPWKKPCWKGERGREERRKGRTSLSRILEAGKRRETGRKEVLC